MSRRTILSTERLTVTEWLPDDFDDLLALHSDPLTMRFIGYGRPDTDSEARSRLDGYLAGEAGENAEPRGVAHNRFQSADTHAVERTHSRCSDVGASRPSRRTGRLASACLATWRL